MNIKFGHLHIRIFAARKSSCSRAAVLFADTFSSSDIVFYWVWWATMLSGFHEPTIMFIRRPFFFHLAFVNREKYLRNDCLPGTHVLDGIFRTFMFFIIQPPPYCFPKILVSTGEISKNVRWIIFRKRNVRPQTPPSASGTRIPSFLFSFFRLRNKRTGLRNMHFLKQ